MVNRCKYHKPKRLHFWPNNENSNFFTVIIFFSQFLQEYSISSCLKLSKPWWRNKFETDIEIPVTNTMPETDARNVSISVLWSPKWKKFVYISYIRCATIKHITIHKKAKSNTWKQSKVKTPNLTIVLPVYVQYLREKIWLY